MPNSSRLRVETNSRKLHVQNGAIDIVVEGDDVSLIRTIFWPAELVARFEADVTLLTPFLISNTVLTSATT